MLGLLGGAVLVVLAAGVMRRVPPPFNQGLGVTLVALGAWAAFSGVRTLLELPASGCVQDTLHQARTPDDAWSWSVVRESCPHRPMLWRVEVASTRQGWLGDRTVFVARGEPVPRGLRYTPPASFAIHVQSDHDGSVSQEYPVTLQGMWLTPNRVWRFHGGP